MFEQGIHAPSFRGRAAVRYHLLARVLHGLLGLLLVGMFAVGLYMAYLPFPPERLKL